MSVTNLYALYGYFIGQFREWYSMILLLNDSFGIIFGSVMFVSQSHQIAQNMTTNEVQNKWRYPYFMDESGAFLNKFDQGCIVNCLEFWGLQDPPKFMELNLRTVPATQAEMNRNRTLAAEAKAKKAERLKET